MKILDEAKFILEGQRKEDYGDADACFTRIAEFWSTYLTARGPGLLSPHDVANMMILLKVARDAHKPGQFECMVDIIGYATLSDEIRESERKA